MNTITKLDDLKQKKFLNYSDFESSKSVCRACPIGLIYNKVVLSDGNKQTPRVIIIGEAPGADELTANKPFVGKAGKLLRKTLEDANITYEDFLITNIIPCRPLDNQFPKDDKIVYACRNIWLNEEIRLLKPKFVLLVGGKALKFCLGLDGITKHRGKIFKKKIHNNPVSVMATLHPSYVLRKQYGAKGKEITENFINDITNLSCLMKQ